MPPEILPTLSWRATRLSYHFVAAKSTGLSEVCKQFLAKLAARFHALGAVRHPRAETKPSLGAASPSGRRGLAAVDMASKARMPEAAATPSMSWLLICTRSDHLDCVPLALA